MSDRAEHWPIERRTMPANMAAVAAASPGGWVYEIDGSKVSNPDGYVPGEAILGRFPVGPDGLSTGEYARNPGHGQVRDDFTRLESPDHWLGWLPDTPAASVRGALQAILEDQVPGSVLAWVKIIDEPVFGTSFVRSPTDDELMISRRAALAVVFALGVRHPKGDAEILTGAFSWAAIGLDDPRRRCDRRWLDVNMDRAQAEEHLTRRIYSVRFNYPLVLALPQSDDQIVLTHFIDATPDRGNLARIRNDGTEVWRVTPGTHSVHVRGTVRTRKDSWTQARLEGDVCQALTWWGWDVTLDLGTGRERSRVAFMPPAGYTAG